MFLLFQALVLGLVQGLTEFLPVSSSGHLQGVPYLLGWDAGGNLAFDVMVHAGTLVAVVWYFRADLWQLVARSLRLGQVTRDEQRGALMMVGLLAAGTVPAGLAGVLFADVFEAAFASPRTVVAFLYLTAAILWAAERVQTRNFESTGRSIETMRLRDAIGVGFAQALAIFPGVSRAGATIAAGMTLGMTRSAAARFSFLLSIPVIAGAILVTLPDMGATQPGTLPFGPAEITVGVLAAAGSGYWAIRYLLALLERTNLLGFARYVAVFATVLLIGTFIRG